MDFLEGEAEARFAWATATTVARQEIAAFKAARRASMAEISRTFAALCDASNVRLAAKNAKLFDTLDASAITWRRYFDQMEEQQRAQAKVFELMFAPPDYTRVFANLGKLPDYTKMFENVGKLPDYGKLFAYLGGVPKFTS